MNNRRPFVCIVVSIALLGLSLFGYISGARADFQNVSSIVGLEEVKKLSFGNPTWVDFNNDGNLDILCPHHNDAPSLYLNHDGESFINIFPQSGLDQEGTIDHHGFAWGDYDNDGFVDLFIAEGSLSGATQGISQLLKGDGKGHFVNVSEDAGINKGGRTVNWVDYNNDGYLDVLLHFSEGVLLYKNNGDGTFSDMTEEAGLAGLTGQWINVASFADYDNDGDMDLLSGGGETDRLFNNKGDGTFGEVVLPLTSRSATGIAWGDYDNDGDLDVYIARGTSDFYRALVWDESKITFSNIIFTYESPQGLDFKTTGNRVMFKLIVQNNWSASNIFIGSAKTNPASNPFVLEDAVGETVFIPGEETGFFVWKDEHDIWHLQWSNGYHRQNFYGEITSDGEFSEVLTSYRPAKLDYKSTLYRNDGDGIFTDVTEVAGVGDLGNHYGAVWGDYDNDGDLDLYVVDVRDVAENKPNLLYQNNGDGTFTERGFHEKVSAEEAVGRHYGAAWGDYDNDGFLDLFLANGFGWGYPPCKGKEILYKNNGNQNHWLKLNLIGVVSNRSGLGCRVSVETDGKLQIRHLKGGGGGELYSQGSGPLHFGLGNNTMVDRLIVYWPSGIVQEFSNIPANQSLHVVEPSTPPLLGKPAYRPGVNAGVFLWKDTFDGPYHLRVNGAGPKTIFQIRLVSSHPLVEAAPYSLEANDQWQLTASGFDLLAKVTTWHDGVDFKVAPTARTLLAVDQDAVSNPRQLHVGPVGMALSPVGWIVGSEDLADRPAFQGGYDLGLFIGKGSSGGMIEAYWNGDGARHLTEVDIIGSKSFGDLLFRDLETSDTIRQTDSWVNILGRVSTWWDGVDVTFAEDTQIGVAYLQDGLFPPHRVNPGDGNMGMPNAYWLPMLDPYEAPAYDLDTEAGIFLWKNEGGAWHFRSTAGNGYKRYSGSITSDIPATHIAPQNLEDNDMLDTGDPTRINFDFKIWHGRYDGFDFQFPPEAKVYLNIEAPEEATSLLHVGKGRYPVSQLPLDISGW